MKSHLACRALLVLSTSFPAFAADSDGAVLYKQRCAMCHEISAETRAPAPPALRRMSPENIVRSLESGLMKEQGATLTAAQRRTVAEFLTGKIIGQEIQPVKSNTCADVKASFSPSASDWNGWGSDLANTRFQPADRAGLKAAEVPKLKLKWAFAFHGTFVAYGQPTIVGGRVFVPSANRSIYSLDAGTGCQYWSFEAQAPVRTVCGKGDLARPVFHETQARTCRGEVQRARRLAELRHADRSVGRDGEFLRRAHLPSLFRRRNAQRHAPAFAIEDMHRA